MTTHTTRHWGVLLSPFHATALACDDAVNFSNCLKVTIIVQYVFKLNK